MILFARGRRHFGSHVFAFVYVPTIRLTVQNRAAVQWASSPDGARMTSATFHCESMVSVCLHRIKLFMAVIVAYSVPRTRVSGCWVCFNSVYRISSSPSDYSTGNDHLLGKLGWKRSFG